MRAKTRLLQNRQTKSIQGQQPDSKLVGVVELLFAPKWNIQWFQHLDLQPVVSTVFSFLEHFKFDYITAGIFIFLV